VSLAPGHLAEHPLAPGIVGALGLGGYQLLVDLAGVGAGRLGRHAFLLVAPDPEPGVPDPGTQIVLHHERVRDEHQAAPFVALAAQLGYLRLSGYRLALERAGLRSRAHVVDPASGAVRATLPERHGGRLLGRGADAASLVRQALLALALRDERTSGAEAVELADRALALVRGPERLELPAALEAARRQPIR
jgi:hypothetical protein